MYDYQGQAGNNFRVYFREQATQNLYGGLAPCTDTTTQSGDRRHHLPDDRRALGRQVSGLRIRLRRKAAYRTAIASISIIQSGCASDGISTSVEAGPFFPRNSSRIGARSTRYAMLVT